MASQRVPSRQARFGTETFHVPGAWTSNGGKPKVSFKRSGYQNLSATAQSKHLARLPAAETLVPLR